MSALGSPSPLFLASAAADAAAGPIKSVRFNSSDSAHLTRSNPNEGSQRKFTFSFWVKRSKLGANSSVFFAGPSPNSAKGLEVRFDSNDRLYVETYATSSVSKKVITNRVFRDPSAWYHIVLAFDSTLSTENDRLIIYVNGEQIDSSDLSTNNQVAQNFDYRYVGESNADHWIGLAKDNNGTKVNYFNGYLTDFYFIDGAQKDETDFGEFDDNGVWRAIDASGLTFGSNGYHLFDFANESTVGHDSSGNEDDWTANNISTTAGAGNDVLFDVPVNGTQSDTGAGGEVSGNYCTINPLIVNQTNAITSNGNLHVKYPNTEDSWVGNIQGTNYVTFVGTMGLTSGKWYFEAVETVRETSTESMVVGVVDTPMGGVFYVGSVGNGIGYKRIEVKNGLGASQVTTSSMPDFSVGDVVGVALDLDNGKIYFSVNGTYINSGNPAAGTGFLASGLSGTFFPAISRWSRRHSIEADLNFGQRPFNTSAPSGFKAICTANLPTPTIADGSDYFDTKLYNGNGSTQTISGLSFSPDLAWLKRRSATESHTLFDTVRGAGKELIADSTSTEYDAGTSSSGSLIAFNSDGFNLGSRSSVNGSSTTNVAWAWDAGSSTASNTNGSITSDVRANQTAGFSIVSYTGNANSSGSTVGHGLGAVPDLLMIKSRGTGYSWIVWHNSFTAKQLLYLNHNFQIQNDKDDHFNNTLPTNQVFSLRESPAVNSNGTDFICYAFTAVTGYSAFGTYTGNGSSDGPFVSTGFRVAFMLTKRTDSSSDWLLYDSTRDPFNPADARLRPNDAGAEATADPRDFLSNGFKIRDSGGNINSSGATYLYIAFAENPFQANGGLAR